MGETMLRGSYPEDVARIDEWLAVDESFDVIKRPLHIGGRQAVIYFIDGFVKDDIMVQILRRLMSLADVSEIFEKGADFTAGALVPYVEMNSEKDLGKLVTAVLSGTVALVAEGLTEAVMIDARTYPVRSVMEPENDRVLRGARDGFVETVIFNTALIRRHIRDPHLRMKIKSVGRSSKTDVVICYMDNKAEMEYVHALEENIDSIDVEALSMSTNSLAECLIHSHWYNPFPKIRYTERPDAAAASLMEGSVIVICDNSPSVMILPSSLLDFLQESDDYYFPPLTGSYLRLTRILVFLVTLLLTPVWYLLIRNPDWIPWWLDFIKVKSPGAVPIIIQLFLIEFAVDGLKLASLNTPSMLSNSLSVVGALILGEFSVQARWFAPEVILYMAFVSIANFTQPSYELGYAFKFLRMILLGLTALFNGWGFGGGIVLIFVLLLTNQTVNGKRNYLYPLIPFNKAALGRLLLCRKIKL